MIKSRTDTKINIPEPPHSLIIHLYKNSIIFPLVFLIALNDKLKSRTKKSLYCMGDRVPMSNMNTQCLLYVSIVLCRIWSVIYSASINVTQKLVILSSQSKAFFDNLKYHFCSFTYNCKDLRDMLIETYCMGLSLAVNYKADKMFSIKTNCRNIHNFPLVF